MYRLAYRNFSGDHQAWLVSHSVTASTSVGERWYEFRAPETSTSLSVFQQGTFAPDTKYRWMGSIAMDSAQDIALGYSVSSSSVFPSISYTGRVSTDALGTMETEASIIAGAGSQISTSNRWGDYTSMAIDAADDCTFWYTAEYYMVTASFDWSTRLASLKFPNCGTPPPPDFTISASPSSVTVVQGQQGSSTITTTVSGGFNNAITLTTSALPSGVTVGFSPNPIPAPGGGTSAMTITVAPGTATGTYPITVTGTGGTTQHSTIVSLTVTSSSSGDFSISATPASQSVRRGSAANYTTTVTPLNGFTGTVNLSVTGCPPHSTCSFSPNPVGPPYPASTLTVSTSRNTRTATYPLTITGTSGTLQHSTSVSLTVTK
jgi:hypothetical protein